MTPQKTKENLTKMRFLQLTSEYKLLSKLY